MWESISSGERSLSRFCSQLPLIGENPNKGLGIFAKDDICMVKNDWPSYCLHYFLSVNINHTFDLLGVWACKPYISEYYIYQNINFIHYSSDMIIIGDFNSNAMWDKSNKPRSHSDVVRELSEINLSSAYHAMTHEIQGNETCPTYYQYRHLDKGYHIDHCFVASSRIQDYRILSQPSFSALSDHLPLCLDLE